MSKQTEQQEKLFLSLIQWIVQIPNLEVEIKDLSEKQTYQSTKITVAAGLHHFEMVDKDANSFNVVVDGKKQTVVSPDVVSELHYIKRYLVEYHRKNYVKTTDGRYIKMPSYPVQKFTSKVFSRVK